MDTADKLAILITVFGLSAQILAVRKPLAGWAISVGIQPLWYAFYAAVDKWPMMFLATGYAIAAVLHLRKAIRARRCDIAATQACDPAGMTTFDLRERLGYLIFRDDDIRKGTARSVEDCRALGGQLLDHLLEPGNRAELLALLDCAPADAAPAGTKACTV